MNSFMIVEQSFYMIYVLQNLLTQAQLEILLAQLESESESLSLQPKAGDLASTLNASICRPERNDKRSITFFNWSF